MTRGPILIAGAGAIGSVVGAMLRGDGHQVALLGRPAHLDAIARAGLRLTGYFGERTAHGFVLADTVDALPARFDLILLTVKSYDTEAAADQLVPLLGPKGVIVSMQNGIGNLESLVRRFGPERVLGARVIFGAEMRAAGVVNATVFAEPVAVGPDPKLQGAASGALRAYAGEVAALLSRAGIAAEPCADIAPYLWTKLFYNAALNPLGALLGLSYGALSADPDLRATMDEVIEEAYGVATALGVALKFPNAAEYRAMFYARLLPATYNHRPTMLYDLERRGRTDIGALNGKVVELAETLGLRAGTNRVLTHLIRARERLCRVREAK